MLHLFRIISRKLADIHPYQPLKWKLDKKHRNCIRHTLYHTIRTFY